MRLKHVVAFVLEYPWALTPAMRSVVAEVIVRKVHGEPLEWSDREAVIASSVLERGRVRVDRATAATIQARRDRLPEGTGTAAGGATAVVPIHGVLVPRGEMLRDTSAGTTSAEAVANTLLAAAEVPGVERIVLDVDSPGGNIAGITELAATVREVASDVEVVAVANHTMASAAYWLAAGASEIVASPSARVGSIGVFAIHEDISKKLEQDGISPTVISAGKFKTEGNPLGPLSDEAREAAQAAVDEAYAAFVADVATGRRRTEAAVRDGFGEGRAVSAQEALGAGMVDRVATLRDVLAEGTPEPAAGLQALALGSAETAEFKAAVDAHWRGLRHELLKHRAAD